MEGRQVSVDSVTLPSTEVIESGPECVAERIAAVDAVLDGIQRAKKMQNDVRRNAKINRRYNEYSRPLAVSETMFRPYFVVPQIW